MSESQDVGSDVQLHNLRKSVPGCIDAAGTEIVPLDLDGLNDIAFKADKAVGGQGQPGSPGLRGSDRKSLPGDDCYSARSRSKPSEARSRLPETFSVVPCATRGADVSVQGHRRPRTRNSATSWASG